MTRNPWSSPHRKAMERQKVREPVIFFHHCAKRCSAKAFSEEDVTWRLSGVSSEIESYIKDTRFLPYLKSGTE